MSRKWWRMLQRARHRNENNGRRCGMGMDAEQAVRAAGNMGGHLHIPLEKCRVAGAKWGKKRKARRARRRLEHGVIQEQLLG
jgi:hypothetical protein